MVHFGYLSLIIKKKSEGFDFFFFWFYIINILHLKGKKNKTYHHK